MDVWTMMLFSRLRCVLLLGIVFDLNGNSNFALAEALLVFQFPRSLCSSIALCLFMYVWMYANTISSLLHSFVCISLCVSLSLSFSFSLCHIQFSFYRFLLFALFSLSVPLFNILFCWFLRIAFLNKKHIHIPLTERKKTE